MSAPKETGTKDEIKALKKQINELKEIMRQQEEDFNKKLLSSEHQISVLKNQLHIQNGNNIQSPQADAQSLQQIVDQKNALIQTMRQQRNSQDDKIQVLQNKIDDLQSENLEFKHKMLYSDSNTYQQLYSELQMKHKIVLQEIQIVKDDNKCLKEDYEEVFKQNDELTAQINKLKLDLNESMSEREKTLLKQIDEQRTYITSLQHEISEIKKWDKFVQEHSPKKEQIPKKIIPDNKRRLISPMQLLK